MVLSVATYGVVRENNQLRKGKKRKAKGRGLTGRRGKEKEKGKRNRKVRRKGDVLWPATRLTQFEEKTLGSCSVPSDVGYRLIVSRRSLCKSPFFSRERNFSFSAEPRKRENQESTLVLSAILLNGWESMQRTCAEFRQVPTYLFFPFSST